ncbi:MAG TPA: tetratricopeptide repeat protein [Steroidobacteraceae bacterium]|nr:tetratricopeptide repeat protein [Steroidobacteraceae bacterium]
MPEYGRKIATILAADVVEYSRLMGVDDETTLAALNVRRTIFDRLVREFEGRVFGSVGDSLMAEFPSAVNAVRCAQAIQQAIEKENEPLPVDRRLALRIGLNLGDVIEKDDTLFGDGVNVAARLQSLATPGGILISGAVYEHVKKRLPARLSYAGARHVKNIVDPIAVYEVLRADERQRLLKGFLRYARRWQVAVGVVLAFIALIVASLLLYRGFGERSGAPAAMQIPSIAVLPFVDMSPAGDQAYLSDGLSDEILHLLAQSPALRVIARTSSFSFRGESADIATIAERLNVSHVLEGSVRRSGERVRVTAQLIRADTAEHVWSETFARDLDDIFAVQTDIAASVANALQTTLAGDDSSRRGRKINARAHESYLQGLYFWNRDGAGDVARARDYFEQAVQLEPAYARAWSGIAGTYRALIYAGEIGVADGFPKQREAVERALALDPNLAEAQARAAQYYWDSGDDPASVRHMARAMELGPSDPLVLRMAAGVALTEGRLGDAIDLQRRAVMVDPLSSRNRVVLGTSLVAAAEWADAKSQFKKALELSPTLLDLHAEIARILILEGQFDEALTAARQVPSGPRRSQCQALLYHATGRAAEADTALARLVDASGRPGASGIVELYTAEVFAFRGKSDEAFNWLALAKRQTRNERGPDPSWWIRQEMRLSPFLKPLHSDKRWTAMAGEPERA